MAPLSLTMILVPSPHSCLVWHFQLSAGDQRLPEWQAALEVLPLILYKDSQQRISIMVIATVIAMTMVTAMNLVIVMVITMVMVIVQLQW